MPRSLHPLVSAKEKNGGGSFCLDPNVYWEKRVALSMVGAVRSSPDFGEKAFELIAMSSGEDSDGDDEVDRLILRANDSQEVNSWIFEIHKSFMNLMKHFAAVVGSNETCNTEQNIFSKSYNVPPAQMIHRFRSTSGRKNNFVTPSSPLLVPAGNTTNSIQSTSLSDSFIKGRRRHSLGNSSVNVSSSLLNSSAQGHSPSNRNTSGSDDLANMIMSSKSFPLNRIPSSRSSTRLNITNVSNSESGDFTDSNAITTIEKSPTTKHGKYIPPHLRNQTTRKKNVQTHVMQGNQKEIEVRVDKHVSLLEMNAEESQKKGAAMVNELIEQIQSEDKEVELMFDDEQTPKDSEDDSESSVSSEEVIADGQDNAVMKLGGCADPCLVKDSICHEMFIPVGASKVTADYHAYGYLGDFCEIGAVSKCGIRDYNEDAYLILNDLLQTRPEDDVEPFDPTDSYFSRFEQHGLFAIFDGHCGNQAARYAAEKFHSILLEESLSVDLDGINLDVKTILSQILMESVTRLDHEFCVFSKYGGRDWFAGSTAIIVLVVDTQIAVASVGDASGVISASTNNTDRALRRGWSILEEEDYDLNKIGGSCKGIIYKEMNESHCPSRPEEKERIIAANGWITHETDIPMIAQFHRMDWGDRDVLDIFQRCFSDRLDTAKPARILNIYRVCGDLAVSRAIGDREYKAAFNRDPSELLAGNAWKSPAPMPYMTYKDIHNEEHSGLFEGDLVISTPEIKFFELGSIGTDELILMACDGLWDVIDPDDAVRVTRNLLFGFELGAKETAVRLAQLAKGLGSSDNITVIVVKFHDKFKSEYLNLS
jgi:Serine/threonine protein phosphatase